MSETPADFPNEALITHRLTASGERALEALIEAGFSNRSSEAWSPEGLRVSNLLSLLDREAPDTDGSRSLLIDVTMARVLRASERDLAGRIHPTGAPEALSKGSAAMVDELVRYGWRERAEKASGAAALLALLDPSAGARSSGLVDSTLARVQEQIESTRSRFRLSPERVGGVARSGFRLTDLVGVAAAILLSASVVWPMLAGSREQAREALCAANLARAALGFSQYAADHRDQLPQVRASFLGGTWWDVGTQDRSHSANLYRLVKGGYASLFDLSCPGNAGAPTMSHDDGGGVHDWKSADEVSFSYQLPGPGRAGWNGGARFVVLADRSPVVRRSRMGELADPNESSRNHGGRGQNILFGDASIRFHVRPVLESGDNIWLPGLQTGLSRPLTGRETPASDADAFVGP